MQENEFEKEVQQKMDAFQLQPTEAVWQQVRSQLTERKEGKKKYLVIFLLSALLMSSLWVNDLRQHTASVYKQAKTEIEKNSPATTEDALQQHQSTSMVNKIAGNRTEQAPITESGQANNSKIRKTTKGNIKATITEGDLSETATSADENIALQKEPLPAAAMDVAIEVKQDAENSDLKGIAAKEQLKNDSKKENTALAQPVQPSTQKTKSKELNTGFLFAIGRSLPANSDPAKNDPAADYTSGIGSSGPPPTNNAGGGSSSGSYYYPSATQPGLSLVVGFEMSRFITSKTTMGLGLQYQLFTTSIATGEKVTATTGNGDVFLYGNSNHYSSYYHFITLPISLSTQIATIKDRGIMLNTAINFSRLISSNALSFNHTQPYYYQDNTALNKTQVGLSASLLINLAGKNKAPLYIGPDLYYSLSAQASSGMYASSHYRSYGLTIKKMLGTSAW